MKVAQKLAELNLNGNISNNMQKNLTVKEAKIAKIQGNPKTHKSGDEIRLIVNSR